MSPSDYENTLIKAGDSETRRGLVKKKLHDSLGWLPQLTGNLEKKGLRAQVQGISLGQPASCPSEDMCLREKNLEGEGKGNGLAVPQRESTGSFVLRLLSLFCRQESQGRSQRRVSARIFISSPGVPFQGHGLY